MSVESLISSRCTFKNSFYKSNYSSVDDDDDDDRESVGTFCHNNCSWAEMDASVQCYYFFVKWVSLSAHEPAYAD